MKKKSETTKSHKKNDPDLSDLSKLPDQEPQDENFQKPQLYVGIGASAGGLEAIEAFFSKMPDGTGMAFIVIQHLSPDYKSLMVELLSKRTPMPVKRSEEGMRVEANTVYLIPPKTELTIFHGKLLLQEQESVSGLHLPIDMFLKSLAQDQGEKSAAIILSGTGSDGMRGVRDVKGSGGVVLVQSPESAKFDGMPRSAIATGLADFVLTPAEMSDQLLALLAQPNIALLKKAQAATGEVEKTDLDKVFAMIRDQHKVDFTLYKSSTVLRRIERRMVMNQRATLRDYLELLQSQSAELNQLFKELLIGVTSFFRDTPAFELLKNTYLPELLQRVDGPEVRFWVAGCSSGEEAYTLAILVREVLNSIKRSLSVKIFATDVDPHALVRAGAGMYPAGALEDIPKALQKKYFTLQNDNVRISHSIREMVVFAQHNLVKDPPFTNIDLLSCRNLLIYLQPPLQKKALEFFNFSLNEGGLMLLGSSETTGEMSDHFELKDNKWKIYRSKGKRYPLGMGSGAAALGQTPLAERNWTRSQGSNKPKSDEQVLERLLNGLAEEVLPTVIVVNEHYEMLHTSGKISDYFKLQPGRVTNDVTRMAVKELSIPLATGLKRAFTDKKSLTYTNVRVELYDEVQTLNLRILQLPHRRNQDTLVAVLIEQVVAAPERNKKGKADSGTYDAGLDAERRIKDLESELQFTQENLQATIEELETSNEELQATNEELLASNEELQSTNEELQSVNEELHTVNSEHQMRILELTELNNDLDNLLSSTKVATLFLDENLCIRKFTPSIAEMFSLLESDIGRPVSSVPHRFESIDLEEIATEAQRRQRTIELEVLTPGPTSYLLRALPYHIAPKVISGVILTLIDITKLKENQRVIERQAEHLSLIANIASVSWWSCDFKTKQLSWSPGALEVFGIELSVEQQSNHIILMDLNTVTGNLFEESAEEFRVAINRTMKTFDPFDIILRTSERFIRVIGKVHDHPTEKNPMLHGVAQDISATTNLQTALGEKQIEYRELFHNLSSGVCVLFKGDGESGFRIRDINESGQSILNLSLNSSETGDSDTGADATSETGPSATLPGIEETLPGSQECGLLAALEKVCDSGAALQFPVYHYKDPSRDLWLECSIYQLPSRNTVLIFDDVTERMQREES